MSKPTGISDVTRPIMGDLFRVALYAARAHPDDDVRTAVLHACDSALDSIGAQQRTERDIRSGLPAAGQSKINPMTATDADIAVAARVWRACSLVGTHRLLLGSADAVGEGYGVILQNDREATYCSRDDRQNLAEGRSAFNLGLLPPVHRLSPMSAAHEARLRVNQKQGVTISVRALTDSKRVLSMNIGSWICDRSRARSVTDLLTSVDRFGLSVDFANDGWMNILAKTPEATIRLATACSSRAIFCIDDTGTNCQTTPAVLVVLVPNDRAPTPLRAEIHSRSGPLADWLWIPPIPLVLELQPRVRTAIGSWLAEAGAKHVRQAV